MKQSLKENGGLPASILWTLAIVAGVSVANIYYIQPLLNMIRHELGISEFRTNLIAMVTQIGYAAGLLFITPLGDLYQRKKIILVNFFVLIFSLLTIALADNIHLILLASFFTGACSMIPQIFIPIAAQLLPSGKQRQECRDRPIGLADRNPCFTGGQRIRRRTVRMARNVLHRRSHDVRLRDCRAQSPSRYSDQLPGKVRRPDEILLALVKEFPQLRIYSIRAALNFGSLLAMVLPCLQDGASPLSCQQRHHRFAGIMRCGGSINRLLCGEIRKESGCPPLQLHRLRTDPLFMATLLRRRKHLPWYHSGNYHHRHRYAVHPAQ